MGHTLSILGEEVDYKATLWSLASELPRMFNTTRGN